jgi:pyridoxal phosphate enzyme (YggS family)
MIAENLAQIRNAVGSTKLIAVSKTQPMAVVRAALDAGQRVFGENRVQEAGEKFPALRAEYLDIELHLIGPLQSNKARDAVALFDVIQTLDRLSLAKALAKAIDKTGRRPKLYIEVNIGRESQKAGIAPDEVADFLHICRVRYGLMISGLMCIPPNGQDPVPFFTAMRDLADLYDLPNLSMGMSGDYRQAIACGATEVRIGSAIFGARLQG